MPVIGNVWAANTWDNDAWAADTWAAVSGGITCALTGTATETIDEDNITDGGKTIILTLTNDTWVSN